MILKIEKNIPIVNAKGNKKSKYPFSQMEVNDSFFVPVMEQGIRRLDMAVYYAIRRFKIDFPKRDFIRVIVDGGIRVWRTK